MPFLYFTVLVRRNLNGRVQVVLLDHGLYEELTPQVRTSLCMLWKSIVTNDHTGMKKYAAELGVNGKVLGLVQSMHLLT